MEDGMPIQALSKAELASLERGLKQLVPAETRSVQPKFTAKDVQTEFCTIWPKAEPILKIIAKYIGYIPGVGSTAGVIISGLVTAGDAISEIVCSKP
jgi:hypothetical protein